MADPNISNWEALQDFMSGGAVGSFSVATDKMPSIYYRGEPVMAEQNLYTMHVCFKVYPDGQVTVIAADGNEAHVVAERRDAEVENRTEGAKFFVTQLTLPVEREDMQLLAAGRGWDNIEMEPEMSVSFVGEQKIYPNNDELMTLFEAVLCLVEHDEKERIFFGSGYSHTAPANFVERLRNIIQRLIS